MWHFSQLSVNNSTGNTVLYSILLSRTVHIDIHLQSCGNRNWPGRSIHSSWPGKQFDLYVNRTGIRSYYCFPKSQYCTVLLFPFSVRCEKWRKRTDTNGYHCWHDMSFYSNMTSCVGWMNRMDGNKRPNEPVPPEYCILLLLKPAFGMYSPWFTFALTVSVWEYPMSNTTCGTVLTLTDGTFDVAKFMSEITTTANNNTSNNNTSNNKRKKQKRCNTTSERLSVEFAQTNQLNLPNLIVNTTRYNWCVYVATTFLIF
jgi:hypothetical protein